MKKLLLLASALALCLGLAVTASAAPEEEFWIEDGALFKYNGPGGNVVIPNSVTSIEEWAFEDCTSLTSVTIPDSVTSIGHSAFAGCTNLTSVTIPDSVTSISGGAFEGTPWLENQGEFAIVNGILIKYQGPGGDVVIPDGVTSIGYSSFKDCESLTCAVIPDGVTYIDWWAFAGCTNLTSVTIPASLTAIGSCAFRNCANLTDIYYGGSTDQLDTIYFWFQFHNEELYSATFHYNSPMTQPTAPVAYPSTQEVEVNGRKYTFECYALKDTNGNDTNYIKLRDLANVLRFTAARFDVGWNGNVTITTGAFYTSNGTENYTPFSGQRPYIRATAPTLINGKAVNLTALTLTDDNGGGYTYYKLRELATALGFAVDWNSQRGIFVKTPDYDGSPDWMTRAMQEATVNAYKPPQVTYEVFSDPTAMDTTPSQEGVVFQGDGENAADILNQWEQETAGEEHLPVWEFE